MAVEGVRKFFGRFMSARTAKLQEPEQGKVCKPCTVCKTTMKAKEECMKRERPGRGGFSGSECVGGMLRSLKEKGAEEHCKDEIESHNECLRKNGLGVVATAPI